MKEFKSGETVLARLIRSEELQAGLQFFSEDGESIQVGAWTYDKEKTLPAHIHNEVERKFLCTCETLYVISGSLKADIYDDAAAKTAETVVYAGDILILLSGGHGYEILEDGTKVLEIKNGPYPGAERDRRRI